MTSRIYRTVLLAFTLIALGLTTATQAHSEYEYYPAKFRNFGGTVGWRFSPNFPGPGTGKRERVHDAFEVWNAVDNVSLRFNKNDEASHGYDASRPCSSDATYNGIFQRDFDFGIVGATEFCVIFEPHATVTRFTVRFEEGEDGFWDTGTGDAGRYTFLAVAVHEFGHAGGFGSGAAINGGYRTHFPEAQTSDGICYDDADLHTMCMGYADKKKTLEFHDKETFREAY